MKVKYISFTTKVFLIYAILLVVPLTIITIISYRDSSNIIRDQAIYANEQSLDQAASYLEFQMKSINTMLNIISYDPTVQTLLLQGSNYARGMENNWFVQTTDVQNFIYNPYITNEIREVKIYPSEGPASFTNSIEFRKLMENEQEKLEEQIKNSQLFSPIWIPELVSDDLITLVERIPDSTRINKNIGIIKADIPREVFQTIVTQASTAREAIVLLVSNDGDIIAENTESASEIMPIEKIISSGIIKEERNLSKIEYNGTSYISGMRKINSSDWMLIMLVPTKAILAPSATYSARLLVSLLILIILSILFSIYASKKLTGRIRKLREHIRTSEKNSFNIEPLNNGNDEIGELTEIYDEMATRIKMLLEERFKQGYQIKNLELEVMQSTINPHFLYNSLDMICWSAIKNHDPEVQNMAQALCKFYKLSLGRGKTLVELQDEIEHIKLYVNIQNMRFDDKINLILDIPEHLKKCTTFKIMLQPIIENSIIHGIREKEGESGTIEVKAWNDDETLFIAIKDDGVGMSEETIKSILEPSENSGGYGLHNINERIKLLHGTNFGLSFESKIGIGTIVTISLPLSKARWARMAEIRTEL